MTNEEQRIIEEIHDEAEYKLKQCWEALNADPKDMYVKCSNGDLILCDTAQSIFNIFYSNIEAERQ